MHDELDTVDHPIRRARLAKGWTLDQLAEVVKLPSRVIRFYENGTYSPSCYALALIGKVLDEKLDDPG